MVAQERASVEELRTLSLDELLAVQVSSISSIDAKPVREQPGIVSVISRAEISARGARDLTEILQAVPGFELGHDVQGVVGPTFRGLWAHEGKIQLIIDGIVLNESLYGTTQLLNHLSAESIEQVEIIRGPGSVRYGGTAELAVIRLTTRGAKLNGGYATLTPEVSGGRIAQSFDAGVGYEVADWRVSLTVHHSQNFRSTGRYVDFEGDAVSLADVSDITPWNLNLGVGWKDLNVRFIYDAYRYLDVVDYGDLLAGPNRLSFESLLWQADYTLRPADWIDLTPTVAFRRQSPWEIAGPAGGYDVDVTCWSWELPAVVSPTDSSKLLTGVRFQHDAAAANDASYYGLPAGLLFNGHREVSYSSWTGYSQFDLDTRWFGLSVGGRYEHHSEAGGKFVPRIALTRAWERLHLKMLFDQAYRTPNIGVFADAVTAGLQPETTTAFEFEAGYQLGGGVSLVGNAFHLRVEDPLIYSAVADGYFNDETISTYGFEAEFRLRRERWEAYAGYSWYAAGETGVSLYQSGDPRRFLGAPAHKFAWGGTVHLTDRLHWNVNGVFRSERAAYRYPEVAIVDLAPEIQLNTYLEYRWRKFRLGGGIANLLDEQLLIPQPYNGGAAPLPAKRRQFYLRLGCEF